VADEISVTIPSKAATSAGRFSTSIVLSTFRCALISGGENAEIAINAISANNFFMGE
jgi:hypothetical protein